MPRKFVYAPGLPGYGTRGVDGSTGLLGIATYFSAYDGNSDTVTIKSKIIANKELFSTDTLLPGYPDRVYQDGDIFIELIFCILTPQSSSKSGSKGVNKLLENNLLFLFIKITNYLTTK